VTSPVSEFSQATHVGVFRRNLLSENKILFSEEHISVENQGSLILADNIG
jgi:hypothetical protein